MKWLILYVNSYIEENHSFLYILLNLIFQVYLYFKYKKSNYDN